MDADNRTRLRTELERQRTELVAEGDAAIPPLRSDPTEKVDDDEAPLTQMQQSIASNRNRERLERLGQIQRALERMSADPEDFGLCEQCEEPIGARRLALMPWVTLCIDCQAHHELDSKPGNRRKVTDHV